MKINAKIAYFEHGIKNTLDTVYIKITENAVR